MAAKSQRTLCLAIDEHPAVSCIGYVLLDNGERLLLLCQASIIAPPVSSYIYRLPAATIQFHLCQCKRKIDDFRLVRIWI